VSAKLLADFLEANSHLFSGAARRARLYTPGHPK
jgi:hypothetical protein